MNQTTKALRRFACAFVLAASWTLAANAETFAVLSLVGDHLTIIGMGAQLGSHIDQNRQQTITVTGTPFDDFAVRVTDAAIAKARPGASVAALRASDPALYKLAESWLEADTVEIKQLASFLPDSVVQSPDARLILITPYRNELELRTAHDLRGAGKASGLGFYVDAITAIKRADTGERAFGYLGLFANFQLFLLNLKTGAVEAHERVVLGTTRSAARAEDRTPWNALSQEQKVRTLESLLKEGIERVLPRMLSSKPQ
jgi:hypothetical protein